jgi:hypothetical protein
MWKLPNGKTIATPKDIRIGETNYPRSIFRKWSKEELATLGIKPFRETRYHGAYYRSTGFADIETDGEIVRTHTLTNRYTGAELKARFIVDAKQRLKHLWKIATEELEYLYAFDESNDIDISEWQQYRTYLKAAFVEAKSQLQAIETYEDGVEFVEVGFFALLPTTPDELDSI